MGKLINKTNYGYEDGAPLSSYTALNTKVTEIEAALNTSAGSNVIAVVPVESRMVFGGTITGTNKSSIIFTVQVFKDLSAANNITVTICKANIRTVEGEYVGSGSYVTNGYDFLSNYEVSVVSYSAHLLTVRIYADSGFNVTALNNTPLAVELNGLSISAYVPT